MHAFILVKTRSVDSQSAVLSLILKLRLSVTL
jgi:hypothetical protein